MSRKRDMKIDWDLCRRSLEWRRQFESSKEEMGEGVTAISMCGILILILMYIVW